MTDREDSRGYVRTLTDSQLDGGFPEMNYGIKLWFKPADGETEIQGPYFASAGSGTIACNDIDQAMTYPASWVGTLVNHWMQEKRIHKIEIFDPTDTR